MRVLTRQFTLSSMALGTLVSVRPTDRRAYSNLWAWGAYATGCAATVVSFASLSWFSVSGPNVFTRLRQVSTTDSSLFIVDPDAGSEHSHLVWALVLTAMAAAFVTQIPRVKLRAAWMVASLVLLAVALLAVVNRLATLAAFNSGLPRHSSVHLHFGIWLAIVGLVLVAVSVIVRVTSRSPANA